MAEIKPYKPVKLVCGIIFPGEEIRKQAEANLSERFGPVDLASPSFPFTYTDYYQPQMGTGLNRAFVSFARLIQPEELAGIKVWTNQLEDSFRLRFQEPARPVNLDPGYLSASALVMATAKDFSHRIPIGQGIYAHLELLFTRKGVRLLDWTYPDFRHQEYQDFFLRVREIYLRQLREKS
ncbi:MAG: hypothetical protein OP8BY_2077 [Candidatus Saccharicenans subterraneus]|uniref:GTP-binding protein n=1 Tax=Candidatus Saccharicenans subterraneus TaxID=2508984 RepID=A0A3E2BMW9_9BACT|nr:MAG: hypothetical protein OP8BY_2077 [Candidatus Saccharicenans subterraneum]